MTRKIKVHAPSKRYTGPLCVYHDAGEEGFKISNDSQEVTCIECLRALGVIPPKRTHPWANRALYVQKGVLRNQQASQ